MSEQVDYASAPFISLLSGKRAASVLADPRNLASAAVASTAALAGSVSSSLSLSLQSEIAGVTFTRATSTLLNHREAAEEEERLGLAPTKGDETRSLVRLRRYHLDGYPTISEDIEFEVTLLVREAALLGTDAGEPTVVHSSVQLGGPVGAELAPLVSYMESDNANVRTFFRVLAQYASAAAERAAAFAAVRSRLPAGTTAILAPSTAATTLLIGAAAPALFAFAFTWSITLSAASGTSPDLSITPTHSAHFWPAPSLADEVAAALPVRLADVIEEAGIVQGLVGFGLVSLGERTRETGKRGVDSGASSYSSSRSTIVEPRSEYESDDDAASPPPRASTMQKRRRR